MPGLITPMGSRPRKLSQRWTGQLDDNVIMLAWSPDGQTLAAASVSGAITLFDFKTGATKHTLKGHSFGTTSIAFNHDGNYLASAGQDGKARVWNIADGSEVLAVQGGAGWVEHVTWSPVRDLFATAAGKKLRLWNMEGQMVREYPAHPATIAAMSWKPGTEELTTAAYNTVTIWSLDTDTPIKQFSWQGASLVLSWSPDGNYIATGEQDSTVHFWYSKTGKDLQMWGYPLKVKELSWDRGSRYLATGGGPIVTIWDRSGKGPAGTTPIQLKAHEEAITALAYQKKGDLLASGGADGKIILWQPAKNDRPVARGAIDQPISQAVWSPDDQWLAIGGESGLIKMLTLQE